jgi:tetratricopeptide (TPR) repeat protein
MNVTDPQPEGTAPTEAPKPPRKPRGHRRPVIKRKMKRKEVEEELQAPDEFQERSRPVVDWILERWRIIAGAVGLILIMLAVVALMNRADDKAQAAASGELAEALLELPDVTGFDADLSEKATEVDATVTKLDLVIADHAGAPQADQARVEAGNALYRVGDFERALSYYDAAKGAKGLSGRLAGSGAGYSLEALDRFEEAATRFEAVRENSEGRAKEQASIDLGRAYEAQGNTTKAAETYAAFETEFPDSSRLGDVQAKAAALKSN